MEMHFVKENKSFWVFFIKRNWLFPNGKEEKHGSKSKCKKESWRMFVENEFLKEILMCVQYG